MQLRIRSHDVEISPPAGDAIERKLRFALGRHTASIARAAISFSRDRARSHDVRCRIRLRLRGGETILVEDQAPEPIAAATAAAWRADHRLGRRHVGRMATGTAPRRFGVH